MTPVRLLKFSTSSPADLTPLKQLESFGYHVKDVLAVVGKSEGNGCVNDFSRTLSAHVWESAIPESAVTVFSGGTEGVLNPHVTFVVEESSPTGLVASVGRTRVLLPEELGTLTHACEVLKTVESMVQALKVTSEEVKLVLIKCPLLTSSSISKIRAKVLEPLTSDTYTSMAFSRYASALGIAAALGEIKEDDIEDGLKSGGKVFSTKASCSSGAELEDCHILVLASPKVGEFPLRADSSYMKDAIDAEAILGLLDKVNSVQGNIIQVFVKAEADPSGMIRGKRHTMSTDSDLHSTRHARAAVAGLIAGLTGQTDVYVSGGAEGQGPPGGGSLTIIYEASK